MSAKIDLTSFRDWLAKVNFAEHGDGLEKKYHQLILKDFPNIERFWRAFVVPLTTRLDNYPDMTKSGIGTRSVDESLERICAANYSVYVHLVFAKLALESWDSERSKETTYIRLSSAFDVFESLCFTFSTVLDSCLKRSTPNFERLADTAIVEKALAYYKERYDEAFAQFSQGGRQVTINLHSPLKVVKGYFNNSKTYKRYVSHSRSVRDMRNAIIHDVRQGGIHKGGKFLQPKPSAVNNYRSWSKIEAVKDDEETINRDFAEPQPQAESDFRKAIEILNELYNQLLGDFDKEFFSTDRRTMRDLFKIEHKSLAGVAQPSVKEAELAESKTHAVVDGLGVSRTAQFAGLGGNRKPGREEMRSNDSGSGIFLSGTISPQPRQREDLDS